MTLSLRKELFFWLACALSGILLFVNSHTFYVTRITYAYGLGLLFITLFVFWLRFRKRPIGQPWWMKTVANLVFAGVCILFVIYLLGVVTWFE